MVGSGCRCGALLVLGDVRGRDLPRRIASAVTTGAPTTLLDVPRAARALRYLFTVFPPKSSGGDDNDDTTTPMWQQVRAERAVRCPRPTKCVLSILKQWVKSSHASKVVTSLANQANHEASFAIQLKARLLPYI